MLFLLRLGKWENYIFIHNQFIIYLLLSILVVRIIIHYNYLAISDLNMEPFEIVILVIESIDFLASALFLAFFVNKLRKIKPMAVTNKYLGIEGINR